MPASSDKQTKLAFKKDGATSQAARQFVNQPKTNHGEQSLFSKGGKTMASKMNPGFMAMTAKKKDAKEGTKADMKQDKATVKKAVGMHDKQQHAGKKTDLSMLKKGGVTKMARGGGVETKGKTQGKNVAMCGGGMAKKK